MTIGSPPSYLEAKLLEVKITPAGLDPKGKLLDGLLRLRTRIRPLRDLDMTQNDGEDGESILYYDTIRDYRNSSAVACLLSTNLGRGTEIVLEKVIPEENKFIRSGVVIGMLIESYSEIQETEIVIL